MNFHFPALKRIYHGKTVAYFDGPGGSQVVKSAINAIAGYMESGGANLHGSFPSSWETEGIIANAKNAVADKMNINQTGGWIRAGLAPYSTEEEVDRLVAAVAVL